MVIMALSQVLRDLCDMRLETCANDLDACKVEGHPYYSEGTHFNVLGLTQQTPPLQQTLDFYDADAACADSFGAAVFADGYEDRPGQLINELLNVPITVAWGAGFLTRRNNRFRDALYRTWQSNWNAKVIVLFIAGNDIKWWNNPDDLRAEMEDLKDYYRQHSVKLIYVNVVPASDEIY